MAEPISDPPNGDIHVTYEELAQIEMDFEDIDTEIIARQELLSRPVYTKRASLVRKIAHFWALVLEQAPPEIDTYIQPSDSQVFATCLKDITVTRFETASTLPTSSSTSSSAKPDFGEPRSLCFRFEFDENEWFTDTILEKKFYYRRSSTGWTGRVSDPVKIHWKKGKDLTDGLLDGAFKLWEAEKKVNPTTSSSGKSKKEKPLPEWDALQRQIDKSTEGSQSFFTWFGYRGPHITAAESAAATTSNASKRTHSRSTGAQKEADRTDEEDDSIALEDAFADRLGHDAETEVFPDGEELAIALAEDVWPMALKHFTAAQEEDLESGSEGSWSEEDEGSVGSVEEGAIPDLRSLVRDEVRSDRGGGGGSGGPPSKRARKV